MTTMTDIKNYQNGNELALDLLFDYANIHYSEKKSTTNEKVVSIGVCFGLKDKRLFTVDGLDGCWNAVSVTLTDYGSPYLVFIRSLDEYESHVLERDSTHLYEGIILLAKNHTHPTYEVRTS